MPFKIGEKANIGDAGQEAYNLEEGAFTTNSSTTKNQRDPFLLGQPTQLSQTQTQTQIQTQDLQLLASIAAAAGGGQAAAT